MRRVLWALSAAGLLLAGPAYTADAEFRELTFADPEIVESSGLAAQDGLVATVNDSGDEGRVFVVDRRTGETVGVTRWGEARDVEAVAPAGDGEVWGGDIGDNRAVRDSVWVHRVPIGREQVAVTPVSAELTYPEGARDAEALLVHPMSGRLFVVSKSIFGGTLFAAPERLSTEEPNELEPWGRVLPVATDGAFFPDGRHLILRDYRRAVVYTFPELEEVSSFRLPDQPQGEGLAVDEDGVVLVSTEGQFTDVLRVPLDPGLRAVVGPSGAPAPSASPTPTAGDAPSSDPAPSSTPSPAAPPDAAPDPPPALETQRPLWPWLVTIGAGGLVVAVLVRSLRPR